MTASDREGPHGTRNGGVSFWWQQLGGPPAPREPLPGDQSVDVCIVGAGYTGLWTAYHLKTLQPDLRIVVLEARFAGFGASGRNGGWLANNVTGGREQYVRSHGRAAAQAQQEAMNDSLAQVLDICAREGIDADIAVGGEYTVARSPAQLARVKAFVASEQTWSSTDVDLLDAAQTRRRIAVAGALGAAWHPHCACVQPAKLARGLAEAVERLGWTDRGALGDAAHVYMYAQRTADDRIAFGGRGVPYRYGSRVDSDGATQERTVRDLTLLLHAFFPAVAEVPVAHAWSGVLAVPRDWSATVAFEHATGLGHAGGYVGTGVTTTHLAGRTLADLVLRRDTAITRLPWVGHHSRRWEIEPLRWLAVHGLYAAYRAADRVEATGRRDTTARIAKAANLVSGL